MNICEAMEYINGFSKLGKPVKDLGRFGKVMNMLGAPQDKLKFIHVAGTNGKGSVVRMLAAALADAGYVTGEFTSPYIHVYNDRIRINGKNIADDELCEIVEKIKPVFDDLRNECSQFELSTAIAFIYYAAKKCDVVVLEAGLGGKLDCTNIIKETLVSVITSVSYDHTKILGGRIEDIAQQKAGIIKKGCPVVYECQKYKETEAVIKATVEKLESRSSTPDMSQLKIIKSDHTGNMFEYKEKVYETSMIGAHQIDNAVTAITAAEMLMESGFLKLEYDNVYRGIKSAEVPSRCQVIKKDKPFVVIDGAHNPDAMRVLADFVKKIPKSPKVMVCGMMQDKDWKTAIGYITDHVDIGVCVDGFAQKTVPADKLAELFEKGITSDIKNVISKAEKLAGENGMVIIAGSLYLAAALNRNEIAV